MLLLLLLLLQLTQPPARKRLGAAAAAGRRADGVAAPLLRAAIAAVAEPSLLPIRSSLHVAMVILALRRSPVMGLRAAPGI